MASSPTTSNVESPPPSPARSAHGSGSYKHRTLKNPRTNDVFQTIVNHRKSWKTLKGGEVVWPPELEEALIEGLENYVPDDSRETRLLGRFPMRNKFISDWILERTGKLRSAKQVGSRLQQLRDTCGGKRLLNLLSPIRPPGRKSSLSSEPALGDSPLTYGLPSLHYESESCSDSSVSSPATPTEAHATLQNLLYRGVQPRTEEIPDTIVYIDLLPQSSPVSSGGGEAVSWTSTNEAIAEENSWLEKGFKIERASHHPRHLGDIDPTITLLSRAETSAQSHFTVHTDDGIVFSETTPLEPLDSSSTPTMDGSMLYKTPLVPGYWETIAQSADASQYVIIQRVAPEISSSSTSTVFSAMYKFNYVVPRSPTSDTHTQLPQAAYSQNINMLSMDLAQQQAIHHQKVDYPFDESLELSIDTENFEMLGFNKTPNMFDLTPYMPADEWSSQCSPTESAFSVDLSGPPPTSYSLNNAVDEQHQQLLSPTSSFPLSDAPNYGL